MKIVVTGGSGRFGQVLQNFKTKHKILFPSKKELDILSYNKISNYLKKKKTRYPYTSSRTFTPYGNS